MVLSTPSLLFLKEAVEEEVIIAGRVPSIELLEPNFLNAQVIKLKGRGFKEASKIKKLKPDIGIAYPNSFSSALFLYLAGAKKRYGFKGDMRSMLLEKSFKRESLHRAESFIELVGKTLKIRPSKKFKTYLLIGEEELEQAKNLIKGIERPYIVLNPNSRAQSRTWPLNHWGKLIELLNNKGIKPIVIGSEEDVERGTELEKLGGKFFNLIGKTSLRELIHILKLSELLISNDSGPAHIGYTVGTKTVVLFGAGDERKTGPYNTDRAIVLRASGIPCAPCEKNRCPYGEPRCMIELKPDFVFKKAMEFLGVP